MSFFNTLKISRQSAETALLSSLLLAVVTTVPLVLATEQHHEQFQLHVVTDVGENVSVDFADLAVGETRTIISEDGRQVEVTRFDDYVEMNLGDEVITIDLPDINLESDELSSHVMIVKGSDEEHKFHTMHADCQAQGGAIEIETEVLEDDGEHKTITVTVGSDGDCADGQEITIKEEVAVGSDGEKKIIIKRLHPAK